jgi:hypothetical protein
MMKCIGLKESDHTEIRKAISRMNRKRKHNGEQQIDYILELGKKTIISRGIWKINEMQEELQTIWRGLEFNQFVSESSDGTTRRKLVAEFKEPDEIVRVSYSKEVIQSNCQR